MLEHVDAWQKFSTVETMGTRACDLRLGWRQEADQSCGTRETNGETLYVLCKSSTNELALLSHTHPFFFSFLFLGKVQIGCKLIL